MYKATTGSTSELVAYAAGTHSIGELESYIKIFKDTAESEQKWLDEFWHEIAVSEALIMARRIYERNT